MYGADDGNAFVLGLMLAGAVEVRGTNETALSLDEPLGSAALIRFEGDGRVRYAGVIKSIEGEVFLGTLLSVQNVWLTLSATGPTIPLIDGMSEDGTEVRSAAVRLPRNGADMPYATRALSVAGLQQLSAMSNGSDDATTTVGFTFDAVTVPGVDGAEVVDSDGRLLRFSFSADGELRSWRGLQLFEPGEIRPGPLFQHYFPWALIDADRGMFVLSEFGGAKTFGEGADEESVVHARRGVAVAVYDGSGRLFEVDSIIHDSDESARTLATGGQLTEEGLVVWGWSSGRLAIGDRGLEIGSSRRAVSASWGWDGRLKWARAHGEGSGSAMFTAGALSEGELIVLGVVDGRLDMSGSTLSTLGPSAFVANLGPPNGLECGTDSVGR
ncbi:MAG TPA: hypothetical protein PK095_21790 [Myxococcota bacterium]|nr:hypothetical protein [Myxococcota bacterium]